MDSRTGLQSILLASVLVLVAACGESEPPVPGSESPAHEVSTEVSAPPKSAEQDVYDAISAEVERRMSAHQIPGASVAIIKNYEIVWARGFGVRQVDGEEEITVDTRFQACSLSKPVAVRGLLTLVDEGLVKLDEPANHYLKSWKIPDAEGLPGDAITVRHLVTHSSGLTSGFFPGYEPGTELPPSIPHILDGKPPTTSDKVVPDFPAGSRWRYSGGALLVAQLLIEDVSGENFENFIQTRVLKPLGMTQSTYASPYPAELVSVSAMGHGMDTKEIEGGYREYPSSAVAGLWTTASDMAKSMVSLQRTVNLNQPGVLQPETASLMLTEQDTGTQPVINDVPTFNVRMGVGYLLEGLNPQDDGTNRFWHWGDNPGYKALQVGTKEGGNGVVIMTNSDAGVEITRPIAEFVANSFGWPLDQSFDMDNVLEAD